MDPTVLIALISQAIQTAASLSEKFKKKDDRPDPTQELSERLIRLSVRVQALEDMNKTQNEVLVKLGESCREVALLTQENRKRSLLALILAAAAAALAAIALGLAIAWRA